MIHYHAHTGELRAMYRMVLVDICARSGSAHQQPLPTCVGPSEIKTMIDRARDGETTVHEAIELYRKCFLIPPYHGKTTLSVAYAFGTGVHYDAVKSATIAWH